jgi:hypothetical protein
VRESGKIARSWAAKPPEGLIYELFLDENGEKISKSKGNGLTIDQWLTYGSEESLGFYLFREPKSAKQLHVGVIPRAVDEYWQFREKLAAAGRAAARQSGVAPAARHRDGRARARAAGDLSACCSTSSACWALMPRASRCGPISATTFTMPIRRIIPRSTCWSTRRWPITAISSRRR